VRALVALAVPVLVALVRVAELVPVALVPAVELARAVPVLVERLALAVPALVALAPAAELARAVRALVALAVPVLVALVRVAELVPVELPPGTRPTCTLSMPSGAAAQRRVIPAASHHKARRCGRSRVSGTRTGSSATSWRIQWRSMVNASGRSRPYASNTMGSGCSSSRYSSRSSVELLHLSVQFDLEQQNHKIMRSNSRQIPIGRSVRNEGKVPRVNIGGGEKNGDRSNVLSHLQSYAEAAIKPPQIRRGSHRDIKLHG
jgi:hypothetical protein